MTSNHAICKNIQWQANLALKLNQRNNKLLTKPVPILFGLWSHRFKKLHLIAKELELVDIQVKLNNSHSKVINTHIQIIEKNDLQNK